MTSPLTSTPPCVTIYTFGKDIANLHSPLITNIIKQLTAKGISKELIQTRPLHNDRELAKNIAEQAGSGVDWPILFANGAYINSDIDAWIAQLPNYHDMNSDTKQSSGKYHFSPLPTSLRQGTSDEEFTDVDITKTPSELESASSLLDFTEDLSSSHDIASSGVSASEEILQFSIDESSSEEEEGELLIIPPASPVSEEELGLGIMGQTLEGLERSVVGISEYMRSAMNIVGLSPPADPSLSPRPGAETPAGKSLVEYKVIQTNWYYRQQTRVLRFYPECFARVHPITDAVRSVHDYVDITEIRLLSDTEFEIKYFGDIPAETYQSPLAKEIVNLVTKMRSKNHALPQA